MKTRSQKAVLIIYSPNMIGRLAGKVRYPEFIDWYMGCGASYT